MCEGVNGKRTPFLDKGGVPRSGGVVGSRNQSFNRHHPGASRQFLYTFYDRSQSEQVRSSKWSERFQAAFSEQLEVVVHDQDSRFESYKACPAVHFTVSLL